MIDPTMPHTPYAYQVSYVRDQALPCAIVISRVFRIWVAQNNAYSSEPSSCLAFQPTRVMPHAVTPPHVTPSCGLTDGWLLHTPSKRQGDCANEVASTTLRLQPEIGVGTCFDMRTSHALTQHRPLA
jgi:hypothetical protein